MKLKFMAVAAIAALVFTACDDTTDELGNTLTDKMDNMDVSYGTFNVLTNSVVADSVYSNGAEPILGKIKDPETGNYITGQYTTQLFPAVKGFYYPSNMVIDNKYEDGKVYADSCFLQLAYDEKFGDSTQVMNTTAYLLDKPMEESKYYSNYDALKDGYYTHSSFHQSKGYKLANDVHLIKIPFNQEFTKDGVTYNNLGTYIMQKYQENPEIFNDPYQFIQKLLPGFAIENTGGIGNMAKVYATQLVIWYNGQFTTQTTDSKGAVKDTLITGSFFTRLDGTEEVLQTTQIKNDAAKINSLAKDSSCTYIKTPAGIFTEVTFPVEEIMKGHENDTLNAAQVLFKCMNNEVKSDYSLTPPTAVLIMPKDSVYTFFENKIIYDNKTSFLSSYATGKTNGYQFSNLSGLISWMYKKHKSDVAKGITDPNWNKAVLVPVYKTTRLLSDNSTSIVRVSNEMGLYSTKLVKGTESDPIKMNVIWSKFVEKE